MKDFENLRNFLNKQIHETDNRDFDRSAATLEIYIDDAGFFTAGGEWAEVQVLLTVDYEKTPIYGTYEDRFGYSHREVDAVTLDEEGRTINMCSVTIGGQVSPILTAYAESVLLETEVATREELQSMEWSIDDFSDIEDEDDNPYDDDYWYEQARDLRLLS
ncbi:MAG: hypothetical protein ACI3X6_03055, partial [Alloprevotella sp.]